MVRVNSSILCDYYVKDNANKKAKCNVCGVYISYKTTTGNLKAHLKNRHIEIYRIVTDHQTTSLHKMKRVNTGNVCDYYVKDNANKKAKCNVCGVYISYKTTTGNLKSHLKNRHIEIYRIVTDHQTTSLPKMKRVNTGTLWDYYVKDNANKKAKCNVCGLNISYKTSTGNLTSHLKKKHIEIYRTVMNHRTISLHSNEQNAAIEVKPQRSSSSPTFSLISQSTASTSRSVPTVECQEKTQTRLDIFTPKKINKDMKSKIDNDLLELFTKGFQPFSLVEEPCFEKFCRWIPGYQLPSRKHISSTLIPQYYTKVRADVKKRLSNPQKVEKISLTLDMWTSRANENYMAITGHYITSTFAMQSVLLACDYFSDRHTSINIQDFLKKSVDEWNLQEKINFVVSDNASNVQQALTDLGWKHFDCYGHTLNVIVQDALSTVQMTIDKVKEIVRFFKKSSNAMEKLLEFQKTENEAAVPLKLKQDMPTHWNSTFHMIVRFIELQSAIKSTATVIGKDLPFISKEEWILLQQLKVVLKPFDDITSAMSREKYVTASSIIPITQALINTCDRILDSYVPPVSEENLVSPAAVVSQKLKDGLITHLGNVQKNRTFSLCTFLDPRYKISGFQDKAEGVRTKKHVQDLVHNMITKENVEVIPALTASDTNTHTVGIELSPWSILSDLIETNKSPRTSTPLSKAIQEVDLYLDEDRLPIYNSDGIQNCPLQWWQNHHQKYPHLSKLIRLHGNIVATSVPCERIFSRVGLLISDRRTRLDHNKVAKLMFINGNT
ncbi:unnamed protein product [Euphydryas editha]|uniref:BED-type domain-containing protein n=1 Tax=Euphydryas editha TaxID=104508 RepID=A0AAU9TFM1_EUPED|nr:unnamed protein product [Euphydryas editha]